MRISDWSSDVCSSDLKRQKDEEADLERGLQFAGDEGGQQDGEGHVRRRGIGLVLLQIGEELDVLLARLPHHEGVERSEEHTPELQSLMRISYAVFCLKKKSKE